MKNRKTKLSMSLSIFFISFLIITSSYNINSTKALVEEKQDLYSTDSLEEITWKWNTTEVVSTESTTTSYNPSLAVDTLGNVHITWYDYTDYAGAGTDQDIFYKRWDSSSSSWTTTEVVSTESTGSSYDPSVTVDSVDNVHIVWQDTTNYAGAGTDLDIFYKRWNTSSSSWTTTEVVSTESTGNSERPSLAVDFLGNVHVVWNDFTNYAGSGSDMDIFYKHWDDSTSTWITTEVVSSESTETSSYPSLAVDSSGNVYVAWHDETDYDGAGTDWDIFYKHFAEPLETSKTVISSGLLLAAFVLVFVVTRIRKRNVKEN